MTQNLKEQNSLYSALSAYFTLPFPFVAFMSVAENTTHFFSSKLVFQIEKKTVGL
jgi:hypothetical protein